MFTEIGENVVETKEEPAATDLDFVIGKLSISPVANGSSCMRVDEVSDTLVRPNVSGSDALVSAFDSTGLAVGPEQGSEIANIATGADCFAPICGSDPPLLKPDEVKDTSNSDSSNFASISEQSAQMDGTAEVVDEDKASEPNNPLIVYTSSRRRSVRNNKSHLNNDSEKPSRIPRKMASKKSVVDLNSLQILRRRRSLFSQRVRSSAWGSLVNILTDPEEPSGRDVNLGNKKKTRKVKGGQGNRNANRDQTGRKAAQKSCLPTRPISLKIRIGNRSYGMGNATESVDASGKNIPGLFDISESKLVEEVHGDAEFPLESNLKKVMSTDASSLGAHLDTRDSVENLLTSSDHHQFIIQDGHDDLGGNADNRCSDPGTSPDSEVINSVPEVPTFEKGLYNMLESPIMSKACASFGDVSSFSSLQMNSKNRKKKDKHHQLGDGSVEDNPAGMETRTDTEVPAEHGLEHKVVDVPYSGGPLRRFGLADSGAALTTSNLCGGAEPSVSFGIFAPFGSSNSDVGGASITCSNGQKPSKSSRAKGGSKSRSGVSGLPSKKDKASKKKGNRKNVVGKHQINEKGNAGDILNGVEDHRTAENHISSSLGENGDLSNGSNAAINSFQSPSTWLKGPDAPPRNAWVLCDECQKWRRIAAKLADLIEETNCRWTCKDNADKEFADCSIPQEKSNSEINDELEISDASCEEDGSDPFRKSSRSQPKVPPLQSPWKLIKSNVFLHRSRKTQTIDEVMVCHCKPPSDGRMGCGAKCLNRMLNIECVRGTCPCGELCSNQQFQKRKYAKLKWFRCGKKGFGLQALQDISEGQFLIEYVGEVLDIHAYESRQSDYALKGHKHFYFMTLNGSEVIDACARGNLGRYINHSCDPNCRTEKWMVNGEVCVGLFAISDIKKGEEVTFDYNYVRVFGAAAKKCVCGSSNCRGYIGGDLTNSEVIVQEDSDDEDSEPVMICEDKEMNDDWNDIMKHSSYEREKEYANELPENTHGTKEVVNAAGSETLFQKVEDIDSGQTDGCLKISTAVKVVDSIAQDKSETGDFVCNDSVSDAVGQFDTNRDTGESLEISASTPFKVETEDLPPQMHPSTELMDITQKSMKNSLRTVLEPEMTTNAIPSKSRPETVESTRKFKHEIVEGREAKPNIIAKTRRSSSSIKKGKPKSNSVSEKVTLDVDKSSVTLHKSKKLPDLTLKNHVETVEEKLNELLDTEGGISKRKDASRGYLKLLFLTAASGNNHGEAIQSNRDLSMILDALLKTKSRTVLVDIINKNGLQMLHNIMKRYRKEFNKTPILRKLLKVLEYLALREILTLEHITGGPPCAGVESFRDSILTLTEHADKQVHQIARNFRDRWIPRHLRRNCCMEIDDGRTEFHPRSIYGSNRFGKLPSGLDDCSETQSVVASGTVETPTEDPSPASVSISGITARKRKSRWDTPAEDIPPGFSSPCHGSTGPGVQSSTVPDQPAVLGDSQERFRARIPLCYGIPASVMQQFGAESAVGWSIAPGFSFQPFPPLPPTSAASKLMERAEQGSDTVVAHHSGEKRTIECVTGPQEVNARAANDGPGSYTLERKYFRQQKWNHPKLPPWVRMRNGWGV